MGIVTSHLHFNVIKMTCYYFMCFQLFHHFTNTVHLVVRPTRKIFVR